VSDVYALPHKTTLMWVT